MKKTLILVIALVLAMSVWCGAAEEACSHKPINTLFLVDGCCHDFENLPPMLAAKFAPEFQFTISKDRDELIPSRISKYDLVLFYTQGSDITPEQEKGLTEFIANGKGYAGIHSASDSFKNSDEYFKMVGGRFIGHGSGTFPVSVTNRKHEIMQGIADFEITDETYDHAFHKDSKLTVLVRRSDDDAPAVWVQEYGKGRVFFTGFGHGKEAWENPTFLELMRRGMRWAAGKPAQTPAPCTLTK